jgi:hypothetical protein
MNKKKLGLLALSVGVSGSVLFASGFSAMANSTSGYDQYKAAFKHTKAVQNLTGDLSVSVKDNGKNLFAVDSTIKEDVKNHEGSGKINIQENGKTKTLYVYKQGDNKIFKSNDSDVYYVAQEKERKHHDQKYHRGEHDQDVEYVIDALMSGLRNDVHTVNKGNGDKEVTLTLSGNQISPVVQALGSVFVKHATEKHEYGDHHKLPFFNGEELKSSLPKLTQDIKIKQVSTKAEINKQNLIHEQTVQLIVTGKDAAGKEHEVTVNIKVDLSQFNHTVTDKVDLKGKKVQTLQREND